MAIRNPNELGSRRPARRRTGVEGFPGWGGMILNGSPVTNPPHRPTHLENVRIVGGEYIPRPGLSKINNVALDGAVKSIVDFQVRPKKAYYAVDGCPALSGAVGTSVNSYDTEQASPFEAGLYYDSATNPAVMGIFDGRMYLGVDDTLKAFTIIKPPYGTQTLSFSGHDQSETIHVFTGYVITCLMAFDGKLFIGLDAGAGASKVGTWDGTEIKDDDDTGLDTPNAFCLWRDKLVLGFDTADLHIRDPGASPGTWNTVVSAGMKTKQITSYRDNVYLADGATDIWKYDGAAIASVRTIAGATIVSIGQGFGYVFFGYKTAGPGNKATLGRMDSAGTFVDVHRDMTLDEPTAQYVRTITEYRGILQLSLNCGTHSAKLALSQAASTSSAYRIIDMNAGDANTVLVA